MRSQTAPEFSGKAETERLDNAVRRVFSVSKEELQRRIDEWKRVRAPRNRRKKIA